MNKPISRSSVSKKLWAGMAIFLIVSLACNLPFISTPVPSPDTTPTPEPKVIESNPLPPVIVETSPLPEAILPMTGEVSLTFDQPMNRESVEGALKVDPVLPGRFQWQDETTVRFVPDQTLAPNTLLTLTIADTARSSQGLNLLRSSSFRFQTPSALLPAEKIPQPGTGDANPSSMVALTFNQPVVPLGEVSSLEAFTLDPAVDGKGYWLNSSTYAFEPDPAMGGGIHYSVHVNPNLISLAGASLPEGETFDWEFTTAPPALLQVTPAGATTIGLDEEVTLTFNQPMDTDSVEQNFTLTDSAGNQVTGNFSWADRDTGVAFRPDHLLVRGNTYTMQLSNQARSRGGTNLQISTRTVYSTVGEFSVRSTLPGQGQPLKVYTGLGSLTVNFNAPLADGQDLGEMVKFNPKPANFAISIAGDRKALYLSGSFLEATTYHLSLDGDLQDRWGGVLGNAFSASFLVADSEPALNIPILYAGGRVLFASPGDSTLPGFANNLSSLQLSKKPLNFQQFLDSYYYTLTVDAFDSVEHWQQGLTLPRNVSTGIEIGLESDGGGLESGFYLYQLNSPDLPARSTAFDFSIAVAPMQVTIKKNQEEVFIWVTDLTTGQPAASLPVRVYADNRNPVAQGTTLSDGTLRLSVKVSPTNYQGLIVLAGEPETGKFGVGSTIWGNGLSAWEMGVQSRTIQPDVFGYLYSDRPIYRPGQTVYYKAILRNPEDARYNPIGLDSFTFKLFGSFNPAIGDVPLLDSATLELTPYGTVTGQFTLPENAPPGYYGIQSEGGDLRLSFQVAEYRKPEIDVQVEFSKPDIRSSDDIQVAVHANYYFGGAAADVKVRWTLYKQTDYFTIPGGFTTGLADTRWLNPSWYGMFGFFNDGYLTNGEGITDVNGNLQLEFSSDQMAGWLDLSDTHTLVLQAELMDESGQPVTNRGSTRLHPDDFYIGIKPDSWILKSGDKAGFTLQTSNWIFQPVGEKPLEAVFHRIEWVQDWSNVQTGEVTFAEKLTEVGSVNLITDQDGQARIEFSINDPGAYRLDITGGATVSQVVLWAGGSGTVPWPNLPDQHIRLQSAQDSYNPGETAQIFIPNPFGGSVSALVTVERFGVLRSQVLEISGSSETVDLKIEPGDAPNVFISVLLMGRNSSNHPDFRMGYLEVKVNPETLLLNVDLTFEDDRLEPGETARASVRVTDNSGSPVQGEFTMAVVDKAIFALASPNSEDIAEAFYGPQPLGLETSTSLAAYTGRIVTVEPGMGGGGGGDFEQLVQLRDDFRDTAYWSGSFETDPNGIARLIFPVPDNLTTWVVTLRGLTRDTRVGEAVTDLLVTKDLIVRPVTPRFFVAGDRIQLGAVINNNTAQELDVTVNLQASGVILEGSAETQSVRVLAGGRQRVNWWVSVQDVEKAGLVFSARSGSLQDSSTPVTGPIPIYRYASPQTFATSDLMTTPGENLEVVSLPKSYMPTGGELRVELTSTLAGTVVSSLDAMESFPLDFTEPVISHLLANLAAFNLLKESGSPQPDLESRLQKAIRIDLDRLPRLQNKDWGFGWSESAKSDIYLTSYALLAVTWAGQAGFNVPSGIEYSTRQHLLDRTDSPDQAMENWELDRVVMAYYAIRQSGTIESEKKFQAIFPQRERLSPWAKALLALSMEGIDSQASSTLISDLQGLVVRSATGANWQDTGDTWQNFSTPNFNTAIVILALTAKDPASPLLADAMRYLVSHRRASGGWLSSYDSAWVLTAISRYIQVTSELNGNFEFAAELNGVPFAAGSTDAGAAGPLVRATSPLSDLMSENGNALRFIHGEGPGRLYYRAFLELGQPVGQAKSVDRGLTVSRKYILAGAECQPQDCPAVDSVHLEASNPVVIGRVTITIPADMYYVVVEDYIPAGSEIINLNLNTASVIYENPTQTGIDSYNPFEDGWGWWWFNPPAIFDNRIQWVASYLPAGTYTITYQLQPLHSGEFGVIPARAYNYYFPEVEGRSSGALFTIED